MYINCTWQKRQARGDRAGADIDGSLVAIEASEKRIAAMETKTRRVRRIARESA